MSQTTKNESNFSAVLKTAIANGILGALFSVNTMYAEDSVLVPPAPKAPEVVSKNSEKKATVQKAQKFVFPSPVKTEPILEAKSELPLITPSPKVALAPKMKTVDEEKAAPPKNSKAWTVMIVPAQKMGISETEQLATASRFYIDNTNGLTVGENETVNFRVDNSFENSNSVTIQPRVNVVHADEPAVEKNSSCCSGDLNASNYIEIYKSIPYNYVEYRANPAYRHEATMSILLGQLPTKSIHNHYHGDSQIHTHRNRLAPSLPLYNNANFRWNGYPYRRHLPYYSNARFYNRNYFYTNPYRFSGYWSF